MAIIALPEQASAAGRQGQDAPGKMEIKQEFVELRAKGWSYTRIARRLKVSKSTLSNWRGELEEEIASLKAIELEALQEEFYLLKEGRIRLLGEQVKAIRKELEKRDFSDVPTDKLLDILLRYQSSLKEEFTDSRPISERDIAELKALSW